MSLDNKTSLLIQMAELIDYPYDSIVDKAAMAARRAMDESEDLGLALKKFSDGTKALSHAELEELYVRTFDVQAVCCLDVGYLLYGEEYRRGQFLAEIKALQRKHNIAYGSDLPDYLPNVLKLLEVLDKEDAELIAKTFVYPAVLKMIEAFRKGENFYKYPLVAIKEHLKTMYELGDAQEIQYLPVLDQEDACLPI